MPPATGLADRNKRESGRWAGPSRLFISALLCCVFVFVLQLFSSGCSSRLETPVANADSTWVYAAKDSGGIEANITFCGKSPSKKTGKRRSVKDAFTAGDKAKVYAFVDLENQFALGDRSLEFHLVWIGPNDRSFYRKRIEYLPTDSTSTLRSRITLPPDRREPGTYAFRVYFFRELIAERTFDVAHKKDAEADG